MNVDFSGRAIIFNGFSVFSARKKKHALALCHSGASDPLSGRSGRTKKKKPFPSQRIAGAFIRPTFWPHTTSLVPALQPPHPSSSQSPLFFQKARAMHGVCLTNISSFFNSQSPLSPPQKQERCMECVIDISSLFAFVTTT